MQVQRHPANFDVQANTVLLMLPGAMQQPTDFIDGGFLRAIQRRGLSLDLHLASFDVEIIGDITSTDTLQQIDVTLIQPAREAGYQNIWLAGISMGALLALAYVDYMDHLPHQVQHLCLLSPYPGNRLLLREIAEAGGLTQWRAEANVNLDAESRMWRCLQHVGSLDDIHLGYGSNDRFFDGLQQITRALPNAAIDIVDGSHDWLTWETLWCNFLDRTFPMKSARLGDEAGR